MRKEYRILAIIVISIIMLMLGSTIVSAANATGIKTNKEIVNAGGKFQVTVTGQDGCTDYEITFTCDKITTAPSVVMSGLESSTEGATLKIYKFQQKAQSSKEVFKNGAELAKVEYTMPSNLAVGDEVTVTATILGIDASGSEFTETKTIKAKVGEEPVAVELQKIAITKEPNKKAYKVGEKFDMAGMEVTATYTDGTTKKVTNYTYSPTGELKESNNKITVSYTEGSVTKTVEQSITITASGTNSENNTTNTNNNTNNNISNNINSNTNSNEDSNTSNAVNVVGNTSSDKELPKTGINEVIYFGIAVVGITAVISYIKYKGLKIK